MYSGQEGSQSFIGMKENGICEGRDTLADGEESEHR